MNRQRLLTAALLVSIAANLFFIGGIGYRLAQLPESPQARPLPPNVGWIVRDLSEQRRQELAPLLESSAEQIRPLRRQMFDRQRRINALMAAPDFAPEELEQAFAALRDVADNYQQLSHQQTISILSRLSTEERQMAREFVQRRGPRDGRDGFRGRYSNNRSARDGGRSNDTDQRR